MLDLEPHLGDKVTKVHLKCLPRKSCGSICDSNAVKSNLAPLKPLVLRSAAILVGC